MIDRCREHYNWMSKKRTTAEAMATSKSSYKYWLKKEQFIVLHISLQYSSKQQCKMTNFQVLTTTWTNSGEYFLLSLCFKSVRSNLVIAFFAHIVQHKQDGNILKHLGHLKLIV